MICNACNKKEYTQIVLGVTEQYLCDACYMKYKKNLYYTAHQGTVGKLYFGDCLELMKTKEDNTFGFSFADPPYNYDMPYDNHDDKMPPEVYEAWCKEWFTELRRISIRIIITPGHGNVFMWGRIMEPHSIGCWYKPNNFQGSLIGNVQHEPWLYWSKGSHMMMGGNDVIKANNEYKGDVGDHPCPKPLSFMRQIIKKAYKKNWQVFDPFLGAGTTAIACQQMEIPWVGCEKSEKYCKHIAKRIKQIENARTGFTRYFG